MRLVVFPLLVLGCSLAQGLVLSKCELKEQLMKAVDGLSQMAKEKGMSGENFVAKLVCYANLTSGFSTSVVKNPIPRSENYHSEGSFNSAQPNGHNREGRSARDLPPARPRTTTQHTPPTSQPKKSTRPIRPITLPTEFNQFTTTSSWPTQSTQSTVGNTQQPNSRPPIRARRSPNEDNKLWTYFGIFQLSDGVACMNGTMSSPNICETDCSSFTDDKIDDDISCLLTLIISLLENPSGQPYQEELRRMVKLIFQWECRDKYTSDSDYFADCP